MKTIIVFMIFLTALFFGACKKTTTTHYGAGNGKFSFWIKSDFGIGGLIVKVDNQVIGIISHYSASGITCGQSDADIITTSGIHTFLVTASNGTTCSGNIAVTENICNSLELIYTGGGGAIAGTPGNPRFNLQFTNSSNVDLDLYVTTPNNNTIYYSNKQADNGNLDVDCKCSSCPQGPNENIY